MELPKLKNLILAVLLFTNLFLLVLVVSQETIEDQQSERAKILALEFLAERGIAISQDLIPPNYDTINPKKLSWDRSKEAQQAAAVLGSVEEESLGGEIIRYHNSQGELRFHGNGEFFGTFYQGFSLDGESYETHGAKLLNSLGFTGKLLSEVTEGTTTVLTFLQEYESFSLWGCEAQLIYEDSELQSIAYGKRLAGSYQNSGEETLTLATVLVQFYHELHQLGDVCSEVVALESGYLVNTPLSGSAVLSPVWKLTTDTGQYYLNLVSGKLERIS